MNIGKQSPALSDVRRKKHFRISPKSLGLFNEHWKTIPDTFTDLLLKKHFQSSPMSLGLFKKHWKTISNTVIRLKKHF